MLQPGNLISLSGSNGNFSFPDVEAGTFRLLCMAPGFQSDSVLLDIVQGVEHTFRLNALPVFDDIRLRTFRLSRFFPPEDAVWMDIQVAVSDPDDASDIRRVSYQIPDFGISDSLLPLSPMPTQRVFSVQVEAGDLGLVSLDQLIGKPIQFFADDLPGARVRSDNQFVIRLINYTPTVQFPKGEALSGPFDFVWDVPAVTFKHTFRIEIRRPTIGSLSVLIDQITEIPEGSTQLTYNNSLSAGQYFWYMYIVDEFGNESRSKENPFQVN